MTFSPNWENIIILSQEFPHYGKIFRFGVAQPCTYASPPLPLTWLYVSVCVGSRACLQLFTYDGFSTQDDPPARLPPPMSFSAQPNFLSHPFFSFTSLFRLFSPHVCLPFMPQTFHPFLQTTTTLHPPPSLPSLYISPNPEVPHLYLCLTSNGCVSPPFLALLLLPSKLRSAIALPTTQSPLMSGKPVGIRSATFDHCFYWELSSPCSALGWQGEAESERMKGRTVKLCQALADMCSQAAAEQSWHMHLSAMSSK